MEEGRASEKENTRDEDRVALWRVQSEAARVSGAEGTKGKGC